MPRSFALLTLLFALVATSCTQLTELTGASNAAPQRTDALIEAMSNDIIFHADPMTRDPGEAGCIATAMFGTIGLTRLNEAGVTVESADLRGADLTVDERATLTRVVADCTGATPVLDGVIDDSSADAASDSGSADLAAGDSTEAASADLAAAQSNRAELVEFMVADFLSDPDAPTSNPAEARCMIEGTIDLLGLDSAGIEEMAYSDRDVTRREYNALVDAYAICVDVVGYFAIELQGGGFYAAEASCVAKQFGRGNIIQMMKNSYDLDEDADLTPAEEAELFGAMDRCGIE